MNTFKNLVGGIVQDIVKYICDDDGLSIESALEKLYNSETYKKLKDEHTGLYRESPAYVYELLKDE